MSNNIFILSQPIQTGKTTLLMNWVERQQSISGILTPDVEGKRMLYDIAAKRYYDLQLDEHAEGISIGRFVFSRESFTTAQNILLRTIQSKYAWVIADEIGRLEMDRKEGLEPAISRLIEHYQNNKTEGNLLLVIRDYLLETARVHYGLENAEVLPAAFFELTQQNQELKGLVLCGGQSVRMGRDKAFIEYHGKAQCYHVYEMMRNICNDVFISCNSTQKQKLLQQYQFIEDIATFTDAGPMTGLLSAFSQYPGASFMLAGCDYPYFTQQDMMTLFNERSNAYDAVCFMNNESNFEEPLLAIYEKSCARPLLDYFNNGNTSLRHFLKTIRTKRIIPANLRSIQSVDTPE